MRFSRRFLRMKEENQHFPKMTIIWHKIRYFHTTRSIWRQNKITNVSKRFVYHMSKLCSWRFGYVKIDQHLLLEPFIDKQRELSSAPNTIVNSTYKLVILRIICLHCSRGWSCFICSPQRFRTCSAVVTTICFSDYPLVQSGVIRIFSNSG